MHRSRRWTPTTSSNGGTIVVKLRATSLTLSAERLRAVHRRLLGMDAAYQKIGVLVLQFVQRQFQTSGAHGGHPWAPLKPATLRRKLKQGYSAQPLIRTGELRQRWDISLGHNKVTLRSLADYSGVHQYGTRRLPERPMLPTEEQARALALRVLRDDARAGIAAELKVSIR